MNIVVTGASSGIGLELCKQLQDYTVVPLTRLQLDLSDVRAVLDYQLQHCDMLINCAGTGIGGKIDFVNHNPAAMVAIVNTNLIAPMLLSHKALKSNPNCKIVNITSTNNNRYYSNDLAYSLSKQALADFGSKLKVDYPQANVLEVRLGLTKTNFNNNRYQSEPARFQNIYTDPCLDALSVAKQIAAAALNSDIKFLEISP